MKIDVTRELKNFLQLRCRGCGCKHYRQPGAPDKPCSRCGDVVISVDEGKC